MQQAPSLQSTSDEMRLFTPHNLPQAVNVSCAGGFRLRHPGPDARAA